MERAAFISIALRRARRGSGSTAAPRQAPDGLPVIALRYLVLMKLEAGRTQDLADVSRMHGGAPNAAWPGG